MIKPHQRAFSIGLFFQKLIQNRKMVYTYAGGFLLMSAVFGSLAIMRMNSTDLLRLIQLLAFLGMGCVHTSIIQSEGASFLSPRYFVEYLLYTLLIAVMICIFLVIVYALTHSNILMAFSSACAFLVPFALMQSWFFYKHIPKNPQLVWKGSETMPDQLALSFRNKVPVRFQVSRKYFDMKENQFPTIVSSWVKLGVLFHQFILEQNKDVSQIELTDEDQYQYGWEFYAESMGGFISRQLNPKLNVRENGIAQNTIIVARRVKLIPETVVDKTMMRAGGLSEFH